MIEFLKGIRFLRVKGTIGSLRLRPSDFPLALRCVTLEEGFTP